MIAGQFSGRTEAGEDIDVMPCYGRVMVRVEFNDSFMVRDASIHYGHEKINLSSTRNVIVSFA